MRDINTYGDLKEAVQVWLNRKDSVTINNIPMFINMASKQFTRLVKLPYYEVLVTVDVVDGFNYIVIPQDFINAKHVLVNDVPYNRVDVETFKRLQNSGTQVVAVDPGVGLNSLQGATTTGKHFFTRIGSQMYFLPELETGDKVEMVYQRDIPEFTDDFKEEYCLMVASDVFLYLSLRHASLFLRDNEQEKFWMEKAIESAESLNKELEDAEWKGSSYVVPMFSS